MSVENEKSGKEMDRLEKAIVDAFDSIKGIGERVGNMAIGFAELKAALLSHMETEDRMRDDFRRDIERMERRMDHSEGIHRDSIIELKHEVAKAGDKMFKALLSVIGVMGAVIVGMGGALWATLTP